MCGSRNCQYQDPYTGDCIADRPFPCEEDVELYDDFEECNKNG